MTGQNQVSSGRSGDKSLFGSYTKTTTNQRYDQFLQQKKAMLYFRHLLVKHEWSKHQQVATKELKQGLNSYCDIGLYHLKIQTAILEKLQVFLRKNSID